MSAPVPNANYAPNGYERVSPGHYRRREDDPETRADRAIHFFRKESEARYFATEANPLDDIATLVRSLTYGEMMDLAATLWKMRPEGKEVTVQELPGMWHRWSAK